MNKITIQPHTILFTVAPSGAGKTYFIQNVIMPQLAAYRLDNGSPLNIQYFSTDDIRRELLNAPGKDKMEKEMMHVSQQAFELLYAKIRAVCSYPVKAEVVIIDSTGLDKVFRGDLVKFAAEFNYSLQPLVFDYKDRADYYLYNPDDFDTRRLTSRHLKKLREEVLREVSRKKFPLMVDIKSKDFSEWEVEIDRFDYYKSSFLDSQTRYCIIGDVHGCLDELKSLIELNGFKICDDLIVWENEEKGPHEILLVGDIIDKGYAIKETIEFVHKNLAMIRIVTGNHENYVYKRVTGQIEANTALEAEYFDTVALLEKDEDLKSKFIQIFTQSRAFLSHRDFIVTHAPCAEKHIGKIDQKSLRVQRNFIYPRRRDTEGDDNAYVRVLTEAFRFFFEEARISYPMHICGHVAQERKLQHKNKLMIDTGCVHGRKLTSVIVNPYGKPFVSQVASHHNPRIKHETLYNITESYEKKDVILENLDYKDIGRIKWLVTNKVNYISGTMAPADKDEENNVLESLEKGLEYYRSRGVEEVVLQPKYMGSRANVYLFKDPEACYTVSRNGYLVRHLDLKPAYIKLIDRVSRLFKPETEMLLLDCELLPWRAMGKGLIDEEYKVVEEGLRSEFQHLTDNGFYDAFAALVENYTESGFAEKSCNTDKKTLQKEYGDAKFRSFQGLKDYLPRHINSGDYMQGLSVYSRQIELFGQDGEPEIRPFNILKEVKTDGSEAFFNEKEVEFVFGYVSDHEYLSYNLKTGDGTMYQRYKNDDMPLCNVTFHQTPEAYFKMYTEDRNLEGIVIKPNLPVPGVAPYMKVRNPRYLTLVYGFDYESPGKYAKLMRKKGIKSKLSLSIKEAEIGEKLLRIPYKEITMDNQPLINLYAQMILEERKEQTLDPRL